MKFEKHFYQALKNIIDIWRKLKKIKQKKKQQNAPDLSFSKYRKNLVIPTDLPQGNFKAIHVSQASTIESICNCCATAS